LWLNWSVKSRAESGKSQGKVREFYFFNCVATLNNGLKMLGLYLYTQILQYVKFTK